MGTPRKPAGERRRAAQRWNRVLSNEPWRRRHLSRPRPDCRLSHLGFARMETRCGGLCSGDRASDHRGARGVQHCGRASSGLHRRLGGWQESGRNRRAYQPLGHFARVCVESYYRFTLLSVHRSLWVNEAGHFHAGTGIGIEPRGSDGRVVESLHATISAEPRP
jgi:hypothetical protein